MRVLIDATQIPLNKSGVGNYAVHLIREIARVENNDTFFVLVQSDENCFDDLASGHFHRIPVRNRIFRKLVFRFFLEQFFIPIFMFARRIDLVHSLHYSFPLITLGRKKAVTVPDMTFFLMPENHTVIKRLYFRAFIALAAVFADKVIAISENTRRDFLKRFHAEEDDVAAIPLGRPDTSMLGDGIQAPFNVHQKFGLMGEYLLFIGTLEPRKNLKTLILAYHRLHVEKPLCPLVVVGGKGWGYMETFQLVSRLGLKEKVLFTGFVDEVEKFQLLRRATVFVYPSFYEGFGIPVLEALAFGVPTITSNVSSMPEVAGEAALLVDPHNVSELAGALKKLLENRWLRQELSSKGIEQAKKFSWQATAKDTVAVYAETIGCVR
jgi:glycosyltransferase involved in cell wall biosynthesis